MAENSEEGLTHLDLGFGETVVLGEVSDADVEPVDGAPQNYQFTNDIA